MAVAGDIMIKLAADFADFQSGMDAANQKLDQLGEHAAQASTTMTKFAAVMGGAGIGVALDAAVEKLKAMGEAVEKMGTHIADSAARMNLSTDAMQALEAMSRRTGLSVEELNKRYAAHGDALDALVEDARRAGLVMDESVVKQLKAMTVASEEAQVKLEVLFARIYAPAKTAVLEGVATAIQKIVDTINGLSVANAETLLRVMGATMLGGTGNLLGAAGLIGGVPDTLKRLTQEVTAAERELKALEDRGGARASGMGITGRLVPATPEQIEAQRKRLEDARIALGQEQDRLQREQYGRPLDQPPPPAVAKPERGGGRTQQDQVGETLKRWADATAEATANLRLMQTSEAKTADEAEREYQTRKRIAELTVPLRGRDPSRANEIDSAANQLVKAEQAARDWEKAIADADKTMTKFGDGSRTLQKGIDDLNKQLATGYLNGQAYAHALQLLTDAADKQASAMARLQGGLKGFEAGFEDARKSLEKSSDAYAMGETAFNGLIGAMNEGLLALEGQSKKSFGQIALDFANMLAQMAEKAAASMVFNWLMQATGLGGAAGVPAIPGLSSGSLAGAYQPRQSGGPVYPGMPYIVGETGPERFVPSTAGSIQPLGAGSSNGASATVNVAMSGQAPPSPRAAADFARKVKSAVVDQIANEQRPGGTLYSYGGVRAP